jgi:predicted nucleotidyltransferase
MERDEILARLKDAEHNLRAHGVAHAALFGSVARGENGPQSDIDILVELLPDDQMDVFKYIGIVHMIEDLFPIKVDVADRHALKPYIRPNIEKDAIYAF